VAASAGAVVAASAGAVVLEEDGLVGAEPQAASSKESMALTVMRLNQRLGVDIITPFG